MDLGLLYTKPRATDTPSNHGHVLMRTPTAEERPPSIAVYLLFCVFGISSWLTINATFIQLPVFAKVMPEGWAVASYLTFAIESANVFPIVYMFVSSRLKTHAARSTRAKATVGILVLGTVCSILIALFWRSTLFGGSAVLLFLVFVSGGVDCLTSILYWPFASSFRAPYVAALSVGEGLSGVVGGVVGIIQSPGVDNRFSVTWFFIITAGFMFASLVAFGLLNVWPVALAERQDADRKWLLAGTNASSGYPPRGAAPNDDSDTEAAEVAVPVAQQQQAAEFGDFGTVQTPPPLKSRQLQVAAQSPFGRRAAHDVHGVPPHAALHVPDDMLVWGVIPVSPVTKGMLTEQRLALAVLCWASCLENGVIMSLRTYATLPFHRGHDVLFWVGVLVTLVDPCAASLTSWPRLRCYRLGWLCSVLTLGGLLILMLALSSPHPPLAQYADAGIIVVALFVATRVVVSYTRAMCVMSIQQYLKAHATIGAESGARWAGVSIQAGALVGSMAMFFIVNYTHVFKSGSS